MTLLKFNKGKENDTCPLEAFAVSFDVPNLFKCWLFNVGIINWQPDLRCAGSLMIFHITSVKKLTVKSG